MGAEQRVLAIDVGGSHVKPLLQPPNCRRGDNELAFGSALSSR